jgi:hypothetical protein
MNPALLSSSTQISTSENYFIGIIEIFYENYSIFMQHNVPTHKN